MTERINFKDGYSLIDQDDGTFDIEDPNGNIVGTFDSTGFQGDVNATDITATSVDTQRASIRDANHVYAVEPGDSIQQAVDDLKADYGEGVVELLAGQHTESGVVIDTNISIVGQGDETIWTKAADEPLVNCQKWRGTLSNMLIEGVDGTTSGVVIEADGGSGSYGWVIDNVNSRGFGGRAVIDSPESDTSDTSRNNTFWGTIQNCYLRNSAGPNTTSASADRGIFFENAGTYQTPWSQIRVRNNWVRGFGVAGVEAQQNNQLHVSEHVSSANAVGIVTDSVQTQFTLRESNLENDVVGADIGSNQAHIVDTEIRTCDNDGLKLSNGAQKVRIENSYIKDNNTSAGGYSDLVVSNNTESVAIGQDSAIGTVAYNNISIKPFDFPDCSHLPIGPVSVGSGATVTATIIPTRDFTASFPEIWSLGVSDKTNDTTDLSIAVQNTTDATTVASTGQAYAHDFPIGSGANDGATYEVQLTNNRASSIDVVGFVDYRWK